LLFLQTFKCAHNAKKKNIFFSVSIIASALYYFFSYFTSISINLSIPVCLWKKYLRWTIENHKRAITKKIPKHFISLLDISGLSRVQNIYISFSSSAFLLLLLCLCGILNWRRSSSNVMIMKMKCNNDKINSKQLAVQDVNKLISGKQKNI